MTTVYVVLHNFLWDNPTEVVGVFMSKKEAIQSLVDDVHEYERALEDDEDVTVTVTSKEKIKNDLKRKYKKYFRMGEDEWSIQKSKLK